jgi:agmatine deiminase
VSSTPAADGLRMPAEWTPHERTLMGWPTREELWGAHLDAARADYAAVAAAIAAVEPVTMVAHPDEAGAAAEACGASVDIVAVPIDDSWLRDSGPIAVTGPIGRAVVDFVFNGWGGKYLPYADDDALAGRLAERCGWTRYRAPFVLEGGSITVDGEGTLITTEQCLLHPNRNPGLTRAEIEVGLRAYLGVERVIWIPYGLFDDDDTDGHVDNVAAFVRPGVVLVQGCADVDHPDHDRLAINRRCVEGALDAAGRALEVIEVPVLPRVDIGGSVRPVPYLNLYLANGIAVVPTTGDAYDDAALAVVGAAWADRRVVPVPGAVLAHGGGGVHCITQQVPACG